MIPPEFNQAINAAVDAIGESEEVSPVVKASFYAVMKALNEQQAIHMDGIMNILIFTTVETARLKKQLSDLEARVAINRASEGKTD